MSLVARLKQTELLNVKASSAVNVKTVAPPVPYSEAIGESICSRIAQGMSLNAISKLPGMPQAHTVRAWLARHKDFETKYAHAREEQADFHFERIQEIAENSTPATERVDRLRIDTLKFTIAKMMPRKYGDRQLVEVGLDVDLRAMSDDELQKQMDTLAAKLGFGPRASVNTHIVDNVKSDE